MIPGRCTNNTACSLSIVELTHVEEATTDLEGARRQDVFTFDENLAAHTLRKGV